jgi:hypothetical protein
VSEIPLAQPQQNVGFTNVVEKINIIYISCLLTADTLIS